MVSTPGFEPGDIGSSPITILTALVNGYHYGFPNIGFKHRKQ